MKYKGIIFDLDGTLLDTIEDLADSMNSVLAKHGFPEHPVSSYKIFVGNGMEVLVRRALPENVKDEELVMKCLSAMREEYGKRWDNKTRPYDGINELLDRLAEEGIKTAVLSNKPHDFTEVIVNKYFPDHKFEAVLGQRSSVPPKPDPAGALEISRLMGIPPENILYLGDSNTDMKTANAAGMYAVGALWGFRTAEELKENGAKALVSKPSEVLDIIEGKIL